MVACVHSSNFKAAATYIYFDIKNRLLLMLISCMPHKLITNYEPLLPVALGFMFDSARMELVECYGPTCGVIIFFINSD